MKWEPDYSWMSKGLLFVMVGNCLAGVVFNVNTIEGSTYLVALAILCEIKAMRRGGRK